MTYDKNNVSVIIFAKNEAEGLASVIASVKRYAAEVIVIDGHSSDNTKAICMRAGVPRILDRGTGRGEAVRLGITRTTRKAIVLCDADGSYDIRDIPNLVSPIIRNNADLVLASRHTGGSFDRPMTMDSLIRTLGSDISTMLVNKRFHTKLTDVHYGYRALAAKSARKLFLTSRDHAIEQELVIAALKSGYRVMEIPSREFARAWGNPKLKTYMGFPMFFALLRQLYG